MRPLAPYRPFDGVGVPPLWPAQRDRIHGGAQLELLDGVAHSRSIPRASFLLRFLEEPCEMFQITGKLTEDRRILVALARQAFAEHDSIGPVTVVRVQTRQGGEFDDVRPWRPTAKALQTFETPVSKLPTSGPSVAQLDELERGEEDDFGALPYPEATSQ
jgi:hypothetical protein